MDVNTDPSDVGGLSKANAHLWAHVHAWVAGDPTPPHTSATSRALRAVCRKSLLGYDVAVHAGWIPLSGHRVDGCDDEAGATCRWVNGWFPVSQAECSRLVDRCDAADAGSLQLAVRLEHGLVPYAAWSHGRPFDSFDTSDSDDPIFSDFASYDDTVAKPTTWRAPHVMVCETCPVVRSTVVRADRGIVSSNDARGRNTTAAADDDKASEENSRSPTHDASPISSKQPRFVSQALRRCAAASLELHQPSASVRLSRRAMHCMRGTLTRCDTRGMEGRVVDCSPGFLRGCRVLRWVHLGGLRGVSELPDGFCDGCALLASIEGAGALCDVVTIGDSCFHGCGSLTELDLGVFANVTSIGDHFAALCGRLLSLDLSALTQLETIGQHFGAFGLRSLTEVRLDGLTQLRRVGRSFLQDATALTRIDLSALANVTFVGDWFLKNASSLVSIVTAPDETTLAKVRIFGQGFLEGCAALESINGPLNFHGLAGQPAGLLTRFMFKCAQLRSLDVASFAGAASVPDDFCVSLHAVTHIDTSGLSPALHTVAHRFLSDAKSLTSIDLAGLTNVTHIGNHFLAQAPQLRAVDLSPLGSVIAVGSHFCFECVGLATVNLGSLRALQSLGTHFFSDCRRLEAVEHTPESGGLFNVAALPDHFFSECPALRSFHTAPLCSVRTIGSAFLYGATGLTAIDTAGLCAVTSIEHEFLAEAGQLHSFDTSPMTSLQAVGDYFLANAQALASIDCSGLGALVTVGTNFVCGTQIIAFDASPLVKLASAGESFLYGNRALMSFRTSPPQPPPPSPSASTSATIGLPSLRELPECSLSECDSLTEVDLSGLVGLRSIGAWALSGCPALHAVDLAALPPDVALEEWCFRGTPAVDDAFVAASRKTAEA